MKKQTMTLVIRGGLVLTAMAVLLVLAGGPRWATAQAEQAEQADQADQSQEAAKPSEKQSIKEMPRELLAEVREILYKRSHAEFYSQLDPETVAEAAKEWEKELGISLEVRSDQFHIFLVSLIHNAMGRSGRLNLSDGHIVSFEGKGRPLYHVTIAARDEVTRYTIGKECCRD